MFSFEIKYAKAADKFLRQHEDIRKIYEQDITKLMLNDHPESADLTQTSHVPKSPQSLAGSVVTAPKSPLN